MRALPRIVEDLRKERQARRRMTLTVFGIWIVGLALALLGVGPRADLSEANAYVVASILLPAVMGFTVVLWTQGPSPRPEAWLRRYVPPAFVLTAALILGIAAMPVRVYRSMDYWMCFWGCLVATGLLTGLLVGVAFRHFAGVIRPTLWTRVGFVGGLAFLAITVSQLCCGHPDAFHTSLSHLLPGLLAVLIAAWSAHRHRALWTLPPQGRA